MIIFDLDGTIALDHHRSHLLKGDVKHWDEYFNACEHDEPNRPIIQILHMYYAAGHDVAIWTGRSAKVEYLTIQWLKRQAIFDKLHHLQMRPADDRTQDDLLKMYWLQCLRNQGHEVTVAFEDRQRVVDAWRANGVTCLQVAPGAF